MYRIILKTYLKPLFYIMLNIYLLSFYADVCDREANAS